MNKGILKYELINYLHSGRQIAPILLFICWIMLAYTIAPINIMRNFGITSLVIFMLMLMLSISYASVNNPMIEQSIFIKTKHKFDIYTSKILITFLFCALLTLFGIILPIIINMRSDFALFDRNPTTIDWVFGAILLLVNGFSGGLIGLFANRRIITKHRTAVLFMSFIGLCTIFKGNISADFFLFKFIAWVLPPVFDLCATYTTNDTIQFNDIGLELLWMLGNNSMLITIYIKIMLYKRFE